MFKYLPDCNSKLCSPLALQKISLSLFIEIISHTAERYRRGSQARLNLVLLHGPYLLIIIFGGISNKKYFTNMLKTPSAHKL